MNLIKKQILLVIFFNIVSIPTVYSKTTDTNHLDECLRLGNLIGPCMTTVEEYYYEADESEEANMACTAAVNEKTEQTWTSCLGSGIEQWGLWHYANLEWPRCFLINGIIQCDSSLRWTGRYYVGTCPEGTTLDREEGCIKEDEPQQCEIEVNNPVNTATGSKYHNETIDVGSSILSVDLSYTSNYRWNELGTSEIDFMGPGWNINHQTYITPISTVGSEKYVIVKRPNGRKVKYVSDNGIWSADLHDAEVLTETPTGWVLLTEEAKEIYEFLPPNHRLAMLKSKHFYDGTSLFYISTFSAGEWLVSQVFDEFGQNIEFIHEVNNNKPRIYQVKYSDGRIWQLDYDEVGGSNATGNLEAITYPDSTVKTFLYEDEAIDPITNTLEPRHIHALTGITSRHPVGQTSERYATYQYDIDRRVVYEKHHAKDLSGTDINVQELSIEYDPPSSDAGTRLITNSLGRESTYEVEKTNGIWQIKSISGPGCSSCGNDNTDFVYDVNNNLISKTQDGVATTYGGYDSKRQYAYKIEADETNIGPDERRTDYTYDARFIGKITSITEDSVYSSSDKVTNYVYDANGQMTSMTESGYQPGGTAISKTSSYEYNGPFNQISRIDGPRAGNVDETVFSYYGGNESPATNSNRLEKVTGPEGIVERDNIQWSVTGKVISEDRPNGITINNVYDIDNDRLETSTQGDGVKSIVTQFTYLATGHIDSVTRNYGTPEASTLTLIYDDALRVTRVTDQLGNYVEYDLDTEGNQKFENTHDPSGVLKKQIAQTFDTYDYLASVEQSGVTVTYDYATNGVLDTQTNGNNITTEYSYDSLKRLSQINQDYQGTNQATANTTTGFTYDAGERVKKVTDARGNETNYNYDDFGNLISLVSPDTGTTSYVYDLAGNMTSKTDAKGVTVAMFYDGRNRITSIDYADNTLDTSYVYDQGVNATGMLSSFTDLTGSTSFSYDGFGNLLSKAQVLTGFNGLTYVGFNNLTTSYTYDAYNRLATMTYPSGVTLSYEYDDLNQVKKITTSIDGQAETVVDQVAYLPFGPIKTINFGNTKNYNANYDDGYRLIDYNYGVDVSAVYAYDNNHNITAITRELTLNNDGFSYDDLDRLTYDSHETTTLTYDKLGNRTSIQKGILPATNYSIDASSNKLLNASSGKPRTYDANGNTLEIRDLDNYDWTYNQANRMSHISVGKTLLGEYMHNGIGQRLRKKIGGYDYLFIYDAQGQLVHESKYGLPNGSFSNQHLWDRETIWLGNHPVARVETKYTGGSVSSQSIYYIQTDHLNTPRWITDDAGMRIWSWESDAFGTTAPDEDVDGDATDFEFNMRFPGQYFDVESGMHYNYFRDYEPGTGRYLESDPIGLGGGVNTFIYVEQNPLTYFDESGLGKNGGPWHPPEGTKTKCLRTDDCATLKRKIWVLEKMINSHSGWDQNVPWPRGGGRHKKEIGDLWIQLDNCVTKLAFKCSLPACGDSCKKAIKTITTFGGAVVFVCGSVFFGFGGS